MTRTNYSKKPRYADCHTDRKHFGLGMCYECYLGYSAKKRKDIRRLYRLENPLPPKPKQTLSYYQRNKDKAKLKSRILNLKYYGLTMEDFDRMMEEQGGVCAICERPPTGRALNIDHEHQRQEKKRSPESRKVRIRGLLCHRCNRALGLLGNDPQRLLMAVVNLSEYVEKYYAKRLADMDGLEDSKRKMKNVVAYLERFEKRIPK